MPHSEDYEELSLKLRNEQGNTIPVQVFIDNIGDDISLELICESGHIKTTAPTFWHALCNARLQLEEQNLRILCNGALTNVYPSAMALDMALGYKAYKTILGHHTTRNDLVVIFDEVLEGDFGTVEEQKEFAAKWRESIVGVPYEPKK